MKSSRRSSDERLDGLAFKVSILTSPAGSFEISLRPKMSGISTLSAVTLSRSMQSKSGQATNGIAAARDVGQWDNNRSTTTRR